MDVLLRKLPRAHIHSRLLQRSLVLLQIVLRNVLLRREEEAEEKS